MPPPEVTSLDELRERHGRPAPTVELIDASTVEPERVTWLWPGWLAAGKLHIVAGPPGVGKTTVAMNLSAIVTRGGTWPDGTTAPLGRVLIWSGEDGIADTLVPRLLANGADRTRVHFVGDLSGPERRPFDPAVDMPLLRATVARLPEPPTLLIVDPIVSAVAGDSHKNAETRRALQPIVDFAKEAGCAVLGISHFSKGTRGQDPVERVTGSIAFGALARVVLAAAKLTEDHPQAPGRLLARAKSNLGLDEGGFVYDLVQTPLPGGSLIEGSAVHWKGPIAGTARDLLAQADTVTDPEERTERDEAADWLREVMVDGDKEARSLKKLATDAGHNWRTVERARKRVGVVIERIGFPAVVIWRRPATTATTSNHHTENAVVAGPRVVAGEFIGPQSLRPCQVSSDDSSQGAGTTDDAAEERAAIYEYEAGFSPDKSERLAGLTSVDASGLPEPLPHA